MADDRDFEKKNEKSLCQQWLDRSPRNLAWWPWRIFTLLNLLFVKILTL